VDRRQVIVGAMSGVAALWASRARAAQQAGGVGRLTDKIVVTEAGGTNVVAFSTADGLVLVDSGAVKMWMARLYPTYRPNTCLISNGLATMAFSLPGAFAAKLVHPERKVLAAMGDGAFLMSAAEIETAVRERVPFVILVWVDGGYGLIGWKQDIHFGRQAAVSFGNPDFVQLAESFGARGYQIGAADELLPTLRKALDDVYEFLVSHPQEVIVMVIQDEGVTPQDVAAQFAASGLDALVYRGPAEPPWPTLREMAESDQRVVVMAENNSSGVPWYHQAFEVMQETPYTFHDTTQFSEAPNRGGTTGSLLLMNHWIETAPMPKPSNAAMVNAYDFLLRRARRFQRTRGHLPNFVAVDFYATGDLMRVVQTLNDVRR